MATGLQAGRPLMSLRSVAYSTQQPLKTAFKLPSKAARTLFASWDHLAIALDAGVAAAANIIAEQKTGHYLESKDKQEFLDAVSADTGIPVSELIQVVRGGDPTEQGTWAHPW
jgi:hypothetical protein